MKTHALSIAALATLGSLAAGAFAAETTVYGVVDTGLSYTHGSDTHASTLEMTSGNYAGSRFGLKGREDMAGGLTLGFILEAGFASDTGASAAAGKLFNRESQVYLKSAWGTFGLGRVGAFSSGSSSLSWYWDLEPFETGYTDAGVQATQVNVWRLNSNTLYYVSPVAAGAKLGLQYSLTGTNDAEAAHFSDNDGFFNAALRWDGTTARALAAFEWERAGTPASEGEKRRDNAWNAKLALAWQPAGGPATLYAGASRYKNYERFSDSTWADDGKLGFNARKDGRRLEGWSAFLGGKYTVGRADLLAMAQYLDGKNRNPAAGTADPDYERLVVSLGCHWHLSGRTMIYAIGAWAEGSGTFDAFEAESNRFTAHLGLTHFF